MSRKSLYTSWSGFPLFAIRTHHRRAALTGSPLATIFASFTSDRWDTGAHYCLSFFSAIGDPAMNESPLMPPYGYTFSKSEIEAVIVFIRMVSDRAYGAPGFVYAQK